MTQAGLARGLSRLVASSLRAAWRGHAWELQGLHSWGCLEQPGRPHSRCETCRDVAPPSVGAPLNMEASTHHSSFPHTLQSEQAQGLPMLRVSRDHVQQMPASMRGEMETKGAQH